MTDRRVFLVSYLLLVPLVLGSSRSQGINSFSANTDFYPELSMTEVSELIWMYETEDLPVSRLVSNNEFVVLSKLESASRSMTLSDAIETSRYVNASPAVDGESLVFGDLGGLLYCFDTSTGIERWRFEASGPIVVTPAFSEDMVLFGDQDGRVYALDRHTGNQVWCSDAGNPIEGSPSVHNGRLYLGSEAGRMHAFSLNDGMKLWEYSTGINISSRPVVSGGVLFFVSKEALYGVDAETGEEISRFQLDRWSMSSPVLVQDSIVIYGDYGSHLLAYNANQGRGMWRFSAEGSGVIGAAAGQCKAYFGDDEGNLYALDVSTGELVWQQALNYPVTSVPSYFNGFVYAVSADGFVFAFEATSGDFVAGHYLGRNIFGAPTASRDGVFVGLSGMSGMGQLQAPPHFTELSSGESFTLDMTMGAALALLGMTAGMLQSGITGSVAVFESALTTRTELEMLDAATGKPEWWLETLSCGLHRPAINRGMVFSAGFSGGLSSYDMRTAQPVWTYAGPRLTSSIALLPGIVLFGADDARYHCIDSNSGSELWSVPTHDVPSALPASDGSIACLAGMDGVLRVVDCLSGEVLWEKRTGSPVSAPPVLLGSSVLTVSMNGIVSAYDRDTGSILWYHDCGCDVSSGLAANQEVAIVGDAEGGVSCLDVGSGEVLWDNILPGECGSPIIVNGVVILGDSNGALHFLNVTDGSVLSTYMTDGAISSPACPVGQGIVVCTDEGKLYCLR